TVHFRVWLRELRDRRYVSVGPQTDPRTGMPYGTGPVIDPTTGLPSAGTARSSFTSMSVQVEVYDAKNTTVKTLSLSVDEFGAASGEYTLGDEPPLGVWHLKINNYPPDAHHCAGALFRVEEYKKPEFEVTVKPAKSQAHLGEKISAKIEARYYFGAP